MQPGSGNRDRRRDCQADTAIVSGCRAPASHDRAAAISAGDIATAKARTCADSSGAPQRSNGAAAIAASSNRPVGISTPL